MLHLGGARITSITASTAAAQQKRPKQHLHSPGGQATARAGETQESRQWCDTETRHGCSSGTERPAAREILAALTAPDTTRIKQAEDADLFKETRERRAPDDAGRSENPGKADRGRDFAEEDQALEEGQEER